VSPLDPDPKQRKPEFCSMPDTSIVPFQFETQEVRAIDRDGEPWFALEDVCYILSIANARDAASRLDDDEKDGVGITDSMGRPKNLVLINESGLYSLILTSRKPEAKRFKKWVTSEVLPQIRKTGSYLATPQNKFDAIRALVDAAEQHEKRLTRVEDAIENMGAHNTHRTIKAHAAFLSIRLNNAQAGELGRKATALSKQRGYAIGTQPDDNFFTVNKYHIDILNEVFKR
jgi:prophage antirepressor-like protein